MEKAIPEVETVVGSDGQDDGVEPKDVSVEAKPEVSATILTEEQSDVALPSDSDDTVTIEGKKVKKTKGNYCFPNFLGKAMAKVGPRVQYESSLVSLTFILLGIIVMGAVTVLGTDLSLFIKIMTGVNCTAAFFFLSSSLITTFQQYQSYLSVMGILKTEEDIK